MMNDLIGIISLIITSFTLGYTLGKDKSSQQKLRSTLTSLADYLSQLLRASRLPAAPLYVYNSTNAGK